MKTKNKIMLGQNILLILLALFQFKVQASIGNDIRITGKIINTPQKLDYEKIGIGFNTNDSFVGSIETKRHIQCQIDSIGNFHFLLPNLGKPYHISMVIYSLDRLKKLWDGSFYVEPGDDLKMLIDLNKKRTRENIIITGIGAEKNILIKELKWQMNEDYIRERSQLWKKFTSPTEQKDPLLLWQTMEELLQLVNQYRSQKEILIQQSSITPAMKFIIDAEYADYEGEWIWRTEIFYRSNKMQRETLRKFYLEHIGKSSKKTSDLSIHCPTHILGIISDTAFDLMIRNRKDSINIVDLYDNIKGKFNGLVRDRLLGDLVLGKMQYHYVKKYNHNIRDSLLKDVLETVHTDYVKSAITRTVIENSRMANKTKLIDGSFVGLDGKPFQLSSLKGRVFMLDVWFTGCTGCAIFHEDFEKNVYPYFKDNKDFVVLSINMDLSRSRWELGLRMKQYSSPDYVNIATLSGLEHPFLKYYGIYGAPSMMLVDAQGLIFYKPRIFDAKEMGRMIKIALEELKTATKNDN